MSDKAESKRKVVGLYEMGRDALNVKLRAVGDYLGVPQEDISDVLALVHALEQTGLMRLPHALFVDCLWILGQVREDLNVSHTQIAGATKTVLGLKLRARPAWLKEHKSMVCFIYGCVAGDLPG